MRLYSFVNSYLIPIQKGIQTAHMVAELVYGYPENNFITEWVRKDKTIIILDGGLHSSMKEILLASKCSPWPHSFFREPDLDNMLTCVGILAPTVLDKNEDYDGRGIIRSIITNSVLAT